MNIQDLHKYLYDDDKPAYTPSINTLDISLRISKLLGMKTGFTKQSDYNNYEGVELWLDSFDTSLKKNLLYRICVYFSLKAPYFTFVNYICEIEGTKRIYTPIKESLLPDQYQIIKQKIIKNLENINLTCIDDTELLETIVPNKFTELDGIPATVFEVLFGEIQC